MNHVSHVLRSTPRSNYFAFNRLDTGSCIIHYRFRFQKVLCGCVWLQLVVTCHAFCRVVMAPPVSLELRERIVAWRYELHLPIT
jgi:hypothetical protein